MLLNNKYNFWITDQCKKCKRLLSIRNIIIDVNINDHKIANYMNHNDKIFNPLYSIYIKLPDIT